MLYNKRTGYAGALRETDTGAEVILCGWVQRVRDLGAVVFVDLRDREGLAQCVFGEDAKHLRPEWTLCVAGTVRKRENANPNMPTGAVEVEVKSFEVLSKSLTPPFEIEDDTKTNELLRLEYRYLDLRRPKLQNILRLRHKITQTVREFYTAEGFTEVETPILTASTPEGARDYLIPSRLHAGEFYALPQSPQQYKQLLMVSGIDKYFQIARCFRDEDLRADRQPEFTQIDAELSFVDIDDVLEVNERMMRTLFKTVLGVEVPAFERIPYRECMERFGTDKPDTRFGFELEPFETDFEGYARKIVVPDKFTRKQTDEMNAFVKGQTGLGFRAYKKDGNIEFTCVDKNAALVRQTLGVLRLECAKRLEPLNPNEYKFLWVTEFPLFEYSEEEKRFVAQHHPFTAPMDEDAELLRARKLGEVRAKAYDMVLNGYELCSGSIRIHDAEVQREMFELLQLTPEQTESRFGHLIRAFKYGVPPHGGIGFGLDRIVMLMCGTDNIRDVVAFPKTQQAVDMMMRAPSAADAGQLEELGIAIQNR